MNKYGNWNILCKALTIFMAMVCILTLLPPAAYASNDMAVEEQGADYETITEIESQRESNVKHFLLPDGSFEAIVYSDDVHRKDVNGNWVDIDNRLLDDSKHGYITKDERIVFNKKITPNSPNIFTLSENGYRISLSIADKDVNKRNAKLSNHAEKYTPNENDTIADQYKKMKSIDNTTVITYKNIKKNTSYEYEIVSNYVKEKIILNSISDCYSYGFTLDIEGLEAHLEDSGSVSLYDAETKNLAYTFPVPFMYDAAGSKSYDVQYYLNQTYEGKYQLSIVADEEWINDENRVFPIVIDPTIRPSSYIVYDTYIDSSNPTKKYGSSSDLRISTSCTTFIRIVMPTIPPDAIIRSADLYTAYFYHDGVNTGAVDVGAYQVNTNWDEYTWTWEQASNSSNYGYSTLRLDTQTLSATNGATSNSPQWVNFDITSAAQAWRNNTASNKGIALKYLSTSSNYSVIVKSYESEKYNCPYLTVSYYTDSSQIIEDGVYWIASRSTQGTSGYQRLMDVEGSSANIDTEIQQWASPDPSANKYRAQLFYVKYVGEGFYRIYTFSNPNYCLKIDGNGIVTGDENINPNYTKWAISGSSSTGYTITNWAGSSLSITVPSTLTNGTALELSSKNTNDNNRNRWEFHKFEGYVFSVVVDPGLPGGSSGTGHGFLMFENCSSKAAVVGFVTVMPEQTITIGTAGNAIGIDASISSEEHEGIFYNREAYLFRSRDYYQTRVSLSILINQDDLNIINNNYLRNDEYNDWNLWVWGAKNCTGFAMEVWNAVSDWDVDAYHGWGQGYTPWMLAASIEEYSWHTSQINMPETNWYGYYYYSSLNKEKYFTYVQGTSGAFPTVDVIWD